MICFRCGSDVPEGAQQCGNCGQRFTSARKTFTATTTSFKALEMRRLRAVRSTDALPFAIGDVVASRYEIRDLIGRGPLGVVYRALDQEIEDDVAIKVIHEDLVSTPEEEAALSTTLRKVRRLSQQHIVRLYDEGREGEHRFFSMQLLEGLTLRKVIGLRQEKQQCFSPHEIEPIFNQITMALGHAHRHTVHGDLKPENVIILPDILKLTDFAAHELIPREEFVRVQTEAGRSGYLAPELVNGGEVDARSDIYSLGAILYELLSGSPYVVGAPAVSEVLGDAQEASSGGLDALLAGALAPDPADRYPSAEAFSEALGMLIDARELASVDIRSMGGGLLPEDVTRKVMTPAALLDDPGLSSDDAPGAGRAGVGGAAAAAAAGGVAAGAARLRSPFEDAESSVERSADASAERSADVIAEAEDSYVEELTGDDLDEFPDVAAVRPPAPPPVPGASRAAVSPPELAPPPEVGFASGSPPVPLLTSKPPPSGPWLLRSNAGFLFSVLAVLALAAFGVYHLTQRTSPTPSGPAEPLRIGSAPTAPAEPRVVKPLVETPVAPDAAVVPPAADAAVAAPSEEGKPAVALVAAGEPTPRPVQPKPEPVKPEPVKPEPVKPEPVKPEPIKPEPVKPEPVKPEPVKPEPVKPEPAKPEPVAAAARIEAARREPTPAETPEPASEGDEVACPRGMLLVTTRSFPKGSVKAGKISGAAAVALANDGGAYCIDAYEFPGKGSKPRVSVTFTAAEGLCKSASKRLCSTPEWMRACRGSGGAPYPYGKSFDPNRCNTEDAEGDERSLAAAGSFARCRSPLGAFDMSGNAAEWTAGQEVRGGDYTSADDEATCTAGGKRSAVSARPSIGFRCCADPR